MDLFAEPCLGANAEQISDQQHPDHQFRVDRRPSGMAVERRELCAERGEIEKPIDLTQQMASGYMILHPEPVKQLTLLFDLPHHRRALRCNNYIESVT